MKKEHDEVEITRNENRMIKIHQKKTFKAKCE